MKRIKQSDRNPIKYEFEGRKYSASYVVVKDLVTVKSVLAPARSGKVIASDPERTAQELFRQILEDAKRRGVIAGAGPVRIRPA